MSAAELSAALWRERELLDGLVYALEVEHLLLTAGRTHRLDRASRDVERVLGGVRDAGLTRAVAVAAVADAWAAPADATLRRLIEHSPDAAWREVLVEHLEALTRLTGQIAELREANSSHLRTLLRSTDEVLASGVEQRDPRAYTAQGGSAAGAASTPLISKDL